MVESGIMGDAQYYPSTGNPYVFAPLYVALFSGIAGLFIGLLEVSFLNHLFLSRSYLSKILIKTVFYLSLIALFIFLVSLFRHSIDQSAPPWDKTVFSYAMNFFTSFSFWSIECYIALGIIFTLFYHEVSANIGQSVLLNFLSGKYHTPIEEDRIFMFLDMKDSTSIAEELGHLKYFDLLKSYYADLTESIVAYGGQIYQYVGDEVVVTWTKSVGLNENTCVNCFFHMKSHFTQMQPKYDTLYGLTPGFKAAIHLGQVTSGEIGVIKKDIVFSGDVLNTTARIQALCNQYEAELLVSSDVMIQLQKDDLSLKDIGEVELKGREERIHIYSISDNKGLQLGH